MKATSILVLDVREISGFTDFLVLCTGESNVQINAISQKVSRELRKHGEKYMYCEGLPKTNWVVMDYGDIVVHIFSIEKRTYYDLERLWGDAKIVQWDKRGQ